MKLEIMEVDTDLGLVQIGPVRFLARPPIGDQVQVDVRGLPKGDGPLLGRLTFTIDEWREFEEAVVRVWRLTNGRGRRGEDA